MSEQSKSVCMTLAFQAKRIVLLTCLLRAGRAAQFLWTRGDSNSCHCTARAVGLVPNCSEQVPASMSLKKKSVSYELFQVGLLSLGDFGPF